MKKKILIIFAFLLSIVLIISTVYIFLKKPVLTMPKYIAKEYNLKREKFNKRDVFILSDKQKNNGNIIFYLHGGSYATNLTTTYWDFLSDVAKDTGNTLIIPDYPLTPEFYYKDVFEFVVPLYKKILEQVGKERLIIMGDSAGGGLATALCQYAGKQNIEQPKKLILISPWLDVSMSNPKIDQIQEYDPIINKDLLKFAGEVYTRDGNTKNYLVSPLYGPVSKLENVCIFIGTYDILLPDVQVFAKRLEKQGVLSKYIEIEKAVHIWLLSHRDKNVYHSQQSYEDLIEVIKKEE